MQSANIAVATWSLEERGVDPRTVVVRFRGKLDLDAATRSAEAFATALERGSCDVVWDLVDMTGYVALAPVIWEKRVWPHRRNIRAIRIRVRSAFVRLGAFVLATALGVPFEVEDVEAPASTR